MQDTMIAAAQLDSLPRVERAGAGTLEAFDVLMRRHERQVIGMAYRLLGDRADAQDAAQEVFLRLYKNLKKIEGEHGVRPWLYTVTLNVCRDARRRKRPQQELPEVAAPAEPDAVDREQQVKRLHSALRRLGDREREALVLRDIEGIPGPEVASMLGISEASVRAMIFKARSKLARWLGGGQ